MGYPRGLLIGGDRCRLACLCPIQVVHFGITYRLLRVKFHERGWQAFLHAPPCPHPWSQKSIMDHGARLAPWNLTLIRPTQRWNNTIIHTSGNIDGVIFVFVCVCWNAWMYCFDRRQSVQRSVRSWGQGHGNVSIFLLWTLFSQRRPESEPLHTLFRRRGRRVRRW